MNKIKEIPVYSPEVSCDGGAGSLGHPKIYLHIKQGEEAIACPYCSRTYVLYSKQ